MQSDHEQGVSPSTKSWSGVARTAGSPGTIGVASWISRV